jgi:hypothetical protein
LNLVTLGLDVLSLDQIELRRLAKVSLCDYPDQLGTWFTY